MTENTQISEEAGSIFHQMIWVKPETGLDWITHEDSMKQKEITTEFTTDVETSLNGHIQLVESGNDSFFFPFTNSISHQIIPLETETGLACIPDEEITMNHINSKPMGGDLTASLNLRLARAAEFSVFFLHSEGLEVATIVKGGKN